MSFNHLTIELEVSNDITAQPSQEIAENQFSSSPCKIIAHAQIVENNFSLLLLLTSREHLLVQHKFGTSSRFASVAIKKLFPLKNCSPLSLVTITLDCFVVICISSDGRTIFLIPFCAFMDVTWSQKSTPLVCQPTTFSLLGFDLVLYEVSQLSTANCFQSSTDHTYLIFGDMNGSLIVANLNLRIIDFKIDFAHGICSIHTFVEKDGKRLLISFSDKTQMVFPFEGSVISVRETLLRITSSQAHQIANDLYIFPQLDGSVCVMNSSKNKLSLFDSFHSIWSASPRFCLDCFETNNVHRVICMPQIIAVLTQQNHLFVHLRFSQSDGASVCYVPKRVILPSEVTGKILQLIPSTNSNTNGEDALECFSTVTETGLFTLQTQRPLNDFVIAHLSSHFFSPNCLLTIADSLKSSPAQMCVSLLCHSLRNPSVFDIAQIDGVISLAFKCNVNGSLIRQHCELSVPILVDPNEILFVLHKNSLGHLLLPFLRNKIGKDTGNDSLRQLFLGVILGRIAQISEEEAKKEEQNECQESEKDALECELRNFLLKFETDESEILLFSLRNLLFSCVYVFLFRNASTHSPTVVRFLLESSIWKSNRRRIANLLKCLSFIHWPSVDSFSAAVLAELLPLVPSFNFVQLKSVNKLTNLLAKRSIDSAHSFHLVCSLRLLHFSTQRHDHSKGALKMHGNSVDSGSNFTTLIGEDLFGLMMNNYDISDCVEFRPFFWGEFSAGTQRLLRNQQRKANGAQCPNLVIHSPKNSEKNAIADCTVDDVSATENRWRGRKRRPTNPFVLKSMPQAVQLPSSDLAFCAVACGTEHVLLLTFDGRLFSWGLNRYGQCGNGTEEPVLAPIEVKGKWGRIVSICAGHYHSGFISESDDIYLWGWGLHGQLGNDGIADLIIPSKSRMFTALGSVKKLCLGYSHTLALCADGRVFGCGALSYGQLGIDPHSLEGCPMKALKLVQLQFPMPISLIASKYFHGIALGVDHRKENVLFEWGDSPQSLKMKMFLQKRLFLKKKNNTMKENGDGNGHSSETKREDEALQRIHLHIRKICQWDGGPVKALSAGFNHSALLTADGHLFTWGKSLEMQLGHRNRKERSQPTKVNAPQCTRWSEVVCARNFTTAISVEGNVFVWGRNDKFQLGLGKVAKKGTGEPRTITFKSNKKSAERNVELPMDNCIETPTIVHGLRALVENEEEQSEKQWTETVRF